MSSTTPGRAWVEVDLDALRANYEAVGRTVGPAVARIPMVKADGYGVGAARVVRAVESLAPYGYGVATAEEGRGLRDLGVERPVIVFSPLPPGDVEAAAAARLTAAISDLDALDRWAAAAAREPQPLDFHVEVDTGMGRAGFDWRAAQQWAPAVLARLDGSVRWNGIFTHFQGADAPDPASATTQWARFQDALAQLSVPRDALLIHACNSVAALRWPAYALDAIRPGIFLYGADPAPELGEGLAKPRPVVSLRAVVVRVADVPPGATVGYGATHVARRWERWATLAIGYGDGLPRALSDVGHALLHGERVGIVGRVSMDLTVVDVTDCAAEVAAGDVATMLGRDGDDEITLEQVAAQANTIAYEILTGLGQRLPRIEHIGRSD